VADAAARAVAAGDFALAGRAFAVLRDARLPQPLVEEYENEIIGPFEESVEKACDAAFARTRLYADEEMLPQARKRMFDGSLHQFDREVRPELMKLWRLAGPRGFHLRRALRHAAEWLNELAGRYRHEGWTEQALYVYREARALAPPGAAALAEAEGALRAMGAGAGPGERTEEEYADAVAKELWQRLPPAKLFADYIKPPPKDETVKGCLLQFAFYVVVVVSCFALNECGIINTRRPPRFSPGSYNFNANFRIAVPQFSPFPMPSLMPYSATELPRLTPAELRRKMRRGQAVAVDVRARGEYEAGHIAGAISMTEEEVEGRAPSLRRGGRQVVCYASAANPWRPQIVALGLRIEGVKNVAVLDGGFEAWVAEGLPTEPAAATAEPPKPPTNGP
jgi:rhodanese-related sulfurtransferase